MPDCTDAVKDLDSASYNKMPDAELCLHYNRFSTIQGIDVSDKISSEAANSSVLLIPRCEVRELPQNAGKVSRSRSSCVKKMRLAEMKDSFNQVKECKFGKHGQSTSRCTISDIAQMDNQKQSLNGKRGDKRKCKVSAKSKYDLISPKSGTVSFNSAAGGSNIFGNYGLKSDVHDITKLEDEISLDALLDGSYKCPTLGRDKGRKTVNVNENVLQSVRKVCSILQLPRPVHCQNLLATDNSNSSNTSTCLLSSYDGTVDFASDKRDPNANGANLASPNKIVDSNGKLNPANTVDRPLYQPRDVLERLALPLPKDLESLLAEMAKPTLSSKVNAISYQTGLPPFSWSHASGGHCKTTLDAPKSSTSRSTCQVKWVRIVSTTNPVSSLGHRFDDLESLTYNHSIVPSVQKLGPPKNPNTKSMPMHDPSSAAACSIATQAPSDVPFSMNHSAFGGTQKCQENAVHSPRALAAAQALCNIAACSSKLKKPLQRAVKAFKPKLKEGPELIYTRPDSVLEHNALVDNADEMMPSKKPKHNSSEKMKDIGFSRTTFKGPISWSTPRSSRWSPIELLRDSLVERKLERKINSSSNKSSEMSASPSTKYSDKAFSGKRKLRKLVRTDWSRVRAELD